MASLAAAAEAGKKWPICPACRKPLENNLVASRCNHIFHRDCLYGLKANTCPKCDEPNPCVSALDLYVAFGEASSDKIVEGEGEGSREQEERISKLLDLKSQARDRRKEAEKVADKLASLRVYNEKQEQKLAQAEKSSGKAREKRAVKQKELEKSREHYDTTQERLHQARQRDAVFEYREVVQGKSEDEGLTYLARMASFVSDPAMLLTEVRRLGDHHRQQVQKSQRECMVGTQKAMKTKREIEDYSRRQDLLQKKLGFTAESLGGPAGPQAAEKQQAAESPLRSRTLKRSFSNSSAGGESVGGMSVASSARTGLSARSGQQDANSRPVARIRERLLQRSSSSSQSVSLQHPPAAAVVQQPPQAPAAAAAQPPSEAQASATAPDRSDVAEIPAASAAATAVDTADGAADSSAPAAGSRETNAVRPAATPIAEETSSFASAACTAPTALQHPSSTDGAEQQAGRGSDGGNDLGFATAATLAGQLRFHSPRLLRLPRLLAIHEGGEAPIASQLHAFALAEEKPHGNGCSRGTMRCRGAENGWHKAHRRGSC
eukprot:TRINITY_DN8611_c0_g1_i1.p1 TRINITY_DN8611_c0_g1~~TRINITY_DN8611_c0_g1_i1.p1  ORF type:complete len:549 (+),score=128.34 TRINITY_DN8611_c0_g1_i1:173-1819(+)